MAKKAPFWHKKRVAAQQFRRPVGHAMVRKERNRSVRRFTRRMRPKAEPLGTRLRAFRTPRRGLSGGNSPDYNPQQRPARCGGRSARKLCRWHNLSGGRAAAPGRENFRRERSRPEEYFPSLRFFRPEIPSGFQEKPGGGHAGGTQYPPAVTAKPQAEQ